MAESEDSWQEVFSRARVHELVLSYAKDLNPTTIRKANAGEDIWKDQIYRKPSARIQIVHRRKVEDEPNSSADAPGTGAGKATQPATQGPTGTPIPKPLAWISTLTNSPNAGDGIPRCFFCPAPPLRSWLPL